MLNIKQFLEVDLESKESDEKVSCYLKEMRWAFKIIEPFLEPTPDQVIEESKQGGKRIPIIMKVPGNNVVPAVEDKKEIIKLTVNRNEDYPVVYKKEY